MLIVNADDFGSSPSATDAALAIYDEGLLTSATAMVHMWDSRRSAGLARERGLPLGLHLNLTLPFNGDGVPEPVQELQGRLTAQFDASSWYREHPAPVEERLLCDAVAHQLDAFHDTYGEPTHIDGHHHIHVHPAVLACLPRGLPIRPILHAPAQFGHRGPRERRVHSGFRSADECVGLPQLHPALGGAGLEALDYARDHVLEVMVHPLFPGEAEAMRGDQWRAAVAGLTLGSYRDVVSS